MKADAVWQQGVTGRDQVVVVISNGIDRFHDALRGRIQTAACFSPTTPPPPPVWRPPPVCPPVPLLLA